jgi:hypothetical protein
MEKYFKTTDDLPVLALTLPNHQETVIQEYRRKLFGAGAGVYCQFFVPFFFLGWGQKDRIPFGSDKTAGYFGPIRTEGLICSPEGLLFLKTDLDPSRFPLAKIPAPLELAQGLFLGNYERGTGPALEKIPVPQPITIKNLIESQVSMKFSSGGILITRLLKRPIAGILRE